MENKNFAAIPADVTIQVVEKLKEINALLSPYCVTLTNQQRKEISKMGDGTLAFVQKAFEFAQAQPEFLPSYVDIEQWRIDMMDVDSVRKIDSVLVKVDEQVSDTRVQAGHEALEAALAYYHTVTRATTDGIAGAKPVHEEMKRRYTRGRKKE